MSDKLMQCHRCKKLVKPIRKMWCYICSKCRVVLNGSSVG